MNKLYSSNSTWREKVRKILYLLITVYYTRSKILKYLQKISFLTYQIWSEVKQVNTEKIS